MVVDVATTIYTVHYDDVEAVYMHQLGVLFRQVLFDCQELIVSHPELVVLLDCPLVIFRCTLEHTVQHFFWLPT